MSRTGCDYPRCVLEVHSQIVDIPAAVHHSPHPELVLPKNELGVHVRVDAGAIVAGKTVAETDAEASVEAALGVAVYRRELYDADIESFRIAVPVILAANVDIHPVLFEARPEFGVYIHCCFSERGVAIARHEIEILGRTDERRVDIIIEVMVLDVCAADLETELYGIDSVLSGIGNHPGSLWSAPGHKAVIQELVLGVRMAVCPVEGKLSLVPCELEVRPGSHPGPADVKSIDILIHRRHLAEFRSILDEHSHIEIPVVLGNQLAIEVDLRHQRVLARNPCGEMRHSAKRHDAKACSLIGREFIEVSERPVEYRIVETNVELLKGISYGDLSFRHADIHIYLPLEIPVHHDRRVYLRKKRR